jgi:hypothetical protein
MTPITSSPTGDMEHQSIRDDINPPKKRARASLA